MRTILVCLMFCYVEGYGQRADTLDVLFPYNQSTLTTAEARRIDSFVRPRAGASLTGFSLAGHCDNIGGDPYNDSLSLARVAAVRQYLLSLKVPDTLVRAANAFGKRQPRNDNASEEKRALNRRVQIVRFMMEGDSLIEWKEGALADLFKNPASMPGKTVILRNVNFYGGHHYPDPASYKVLNELTRLLGDIKGLTIEIQGFVCCLPDSVDALDLDTRYINLSTARARFIYDYLAAHGVDSTRMRYRGFQASHKLFPDETNEQERSANRRVQIRITAWKPE